MSSLSFPTEFMSSKRPIFDQELAQNHLGPEGQDSPREYSLKTHAIRPKPKVKVFKQNFLKIAKHVKKFQRKLIRGTEQSRFSELSRNLFDIINDRTSTYDYYVENGFIKGKISFAYKLARFFQWCLSSNNVQIPILMPDQFIVVLINFLVLVTLFIQIMYLPILIAFNSELETNTYRLLDSYVVYVFILEIIVNLNTAFYHKGQIQGNRQQIFIKNLKEGLIFNMFVVFCSYLEDTNQLFLIFRLFKIYQIMQLVEQFEEMYFLRQRFSSLLDILRLLTLLIVIAHICSCAWYFLTKDEQGWLVKTEIQDASVRVKYINSLYWVSITFLTVGYGDISPVTTNEKMIGIVLAYFTCGLFGYAINKIGTIISDQNSKEQYVKQQMALVNSFMNKRKISQNLQLKIRNYYLYFLKSEERKQQVEKIDQALSNLSPEIKTNLNKELYFKILKKCRYFSNLSEETLLEIVTCIEEELYSPNQVILEAQKISQKLYFVLDNSAELNIKNNQIQQQADQFFLNEEEFFCQKQMLFTIQSIHFLKVASLQYDQYINIVRKNKTDNEKFKLLLDNQQFNQEKNYCKLCKDEFHDSLQCRKVFFIPNRQRLLNKYNLSFDQMRTSNFTREKMKSLNSKQNSMNNKAEAINFCLENELLSQQDIDVNFLNQVGLEQENAPLTGRYTLTQIKHRENRMSVLLVRQDKSEESSEDSENDQNDKISQRIQKHRQSKFQNRQTLVNFKLDPVPSGDTEKFFSRPSLQSSKRDNQGSEKEREKQFSDFDRGCNFQIYYPQFNLSRILELFQIIYQAKLNELKIKHPLQMLKNKWISNRTMLKKS